MRKLTPLLHRAIAIGFLTVMAPARAGDQRIECPASLAAASVNVTLAPSGWTPFTPSVLQLHSAGAMAGPPASMADLKEDSSQSSKGQQVDTWHFQGAMPEGKWITCGYGFGNEVKLSKRLDDATTACTVTYAKKKPYGEKAVDVVCTSTLVRKQ